MQPRETALLGVLDAVMRHEPLAPVPALSAVGDPWHDALAAYCLAIACRWRDAARAVSRVSHDGEGPDRWLVEALTAFTSATTGSAAPISALERRLDELGSLPPLIRIFVEHLLREAAIGSNALALAHRFTARFDAPGTGLGAQQFAHPYLDVIAASHVRALAWGGDISAAQAFLDGWGPARSEAGGWLLGSCAALLHGRTTDRAATVAQADAVLARYPDPADYLASGCHLLAGYGLLAVGELDLAARHLLVGGGGADLRLLKAIDRALALDGLTALATAAGDLAAAEAWAEQAGPLRRRAVTRTTVQRLDARVALLAGDPGRAAELAREASRDDRAAGRALDAAQAELLLAAAEIALAEPGSAQRRLERLVASSDATGDSAVRRAAARELRRLGRRLRPAAGAGWEGLTPREREVALLLATGQSNQEIADRLYLSVHTVRVHVSRVLSAYGVATRAPLPALLADHLPPADRLPPLSPRQHEVARLVADGASNAEIAAALGVSVSGVEKHVTTILRRWRLGSRTAIAAALARRPEASDRAEPAE